MKRPMRRVVHGPVMPNGHKVAPEDVGRIPCHHFIPNPDGRGGVCCGKPARWCEHTSNSVGIAFYYFCNEHWKMQNPDGKSPKQRAETR
jgi:hypothetical protein